MDDKEMLRQVTLLLNAERKLLRKIILDTLNVLGDGFDNRDMVDDKLKKITDPAFDIMKLDVSEYDDFNEHQAEIVTTAIKRMSEIVFNTLDSMTSSLHETLRRRG